MFKIASVVLAGLATIIGTVSTSGCVVWLLDEPEMPKSLR